MPNSLLWAVDIFGRVYTLSTAGQYWELCKDRQLEFKRVSAIKHCCWGIACDHQVYAYIFSSDVPIRYQEETYENQRWNPVGGFCEKLMPSDRWQWSDVSGLKHQQLDSFTLPSPHWEWESDWYVDENIGGEPTEKGITSPDDPNQLPDPFNDISIGGWEITDEPMGRLSVWAVSLQGRVWYREDVCHHNPEGSWWSLIATPGEAVQISCGPYDLLWATLWEGQAIVREGIDRNNPQGISWTIVEPPSSENGILHISVGVNVVWAVTKDRKVWFRRGVNSHNPCGTSWIEMVGEMMMVNVGLNDQVWGIGCEDRAVYFRQGVTPSELSGKTWKAIVSGRESDRSQTGSSTSLLSAGCFFSDDVREQMNLIVQSDADISSDTESPQIHPNLADMPLSGAAASVNGNSVGSQSAEASANLAVDPLDSTPEEVSPASDNGKKAGLEKPKSSADQDPHPAELQWTNIDLKEAHKKPLLSASTFPETSSLSSLGMFSVGVEEHYGADEHPLWAWVCGGGCLVDSHSLLKWFTLQSGLLSSVQSLSLSISPAQTAAWRKQIFQQLSERTKRELENFRHYEQAIEQSVWVKTGTLQWWRSWKPHKWTDVRVALEQFTGNDGMRDSILFIYYMYHEEKKYMHVFLNEVTILVEVLNDAKHSFALYTPERTKQRWPIRLAAATEQEMHDWLALLSMSCRESRRIQGPPSHQAIWSVTCKGDIFVSEPSPELEAAPHLMPCDQMFWRQIGGHLRLIECNSHGIVWGIGYDHTAWVYTGGYGGGFIQGLASSADNIYMQSDVKCVYIYENQRWNPVTGYSNRGLPTDRYMWSDASGLQECTKVNTKPPSPQWSWVSDWCIDFNISGGTDREGWQYAADFPASYHGHKTMKDFVRRRRWARKCKIITNGPWLEVPPIALWDIAIIPSSSADKEESIALWAVSNKGDVLCRLGVTQQNPAEYLSFPLLRGSLINSTDRLLSLSLYKAQVSIKASVESLNHASPLALQQGQLPSIRPHCKALNEAQDLIDLFIGNLWYRQGITPSYPQGSSWDHVSNNIRKVSVGPLDQVWVIADKVQGSHSLSCGTVCHRTGVQPLEPKGLSWDYGIGGGWEHITVRGNATEAPKTALHETSEEHSAKPTDLEDGENGGKGNHSKTTLMVNEGQALDRNSVNC
ncbi:Tectonin beta-propeller repeat-containing protein 1 [Chelonia mydas]|uniref:Tectonin beta-propeller repeat-containing protein 1 n=1 Tax=Chelonia mydas TaxID=8469 RepID=M7B0S6_CHEMY|nr:Tectonin beta-propeller repeat-containing protein 1 [Chelonia mydas]